MRPIIHSSLKKTVCMTFLEREMLIFKQFGGFLFSIAYRSGYYNTTNIEWILCNVKKLKEDSEQSLLISSLQNPYSCIYREFCRNKKRRSI